MWTRKIGVMLALLSPLAFGQQPHRATPVQPPPMQSQPSAPSRQDYRGTVRSYPDPYSRRNYYRYRTYPHRHYRPYVGSYRLYPGYRIGLPLGGFGFFYDYTWDPTYRRYLYQAPIPSARARTAVEAGLRMQREGSDLQVWWLDPYGRGAREVTLFIADGNQTVLAMQRLYAGPFYGRFDAPWGVAYVGVTVQWADGSISTAMLPYR